MQRAYWPARPRPGLLSNSLLTPERTPKLANYDMGSKRIQEEAAEVFAGHRHRNNYAADGDMMMVISGPVGFPSGDDPSGQRIVKVYDDRVEHEYFGMDDVPTSVDL